MAHLLPVRCHQIGASTDRAHQVTCISLIFSLIFLIGQAYIAICERTLSR